jgi:hypothetical protein
MEVFPTSNPKSTPYIATLETAFKKPDIGHHPRETFGNSHAYGFPAVYII